MNQSTPSVSERLFSDPWIHLFRPLHYRREGHDGRQQAIGLFGFGGYLLPEEVGSLLGCTTDLVSEASE